VGRAGHCRPKSGLFLEVEGCVFLAEDAALVVQEGMQGHLMPHAAKGKRGIVLQSRGSIFIGGKKVLVIARRTLLDTGPRKRDNERQNLRTEGRRATGGKLFHREEHPPLERNIIDTSERARANYRYVIGQHFGL
jgi:hypothetical protein